MRAPELSPPHHVLRDTPVYNLSSSGILRLSIALVGLLQLGWGPQQSRKHMALSTLAPPFGFLSASSVELFPGLSVEGPLATIEIRAAP